MSDLRSVLDRVGERVTPREDAFERLARHREALRRRHRIVAGGVALLVAVGGITGAVVAFRGTSPRLVTGATRSGEETAGWTISYPIGWHFVSFGDSLETTYVGARLANFPVPGVHVSANGEDSFLGFMGSFPADGVMLQIWQTFPGFGVVGVEQRPNSSFPVSLSSLNAIRRYAGGSEPVPRFRTVVANGGDYGVAVWIGPEASDADRSAVESSLRSWTFLPLQEGSVIRGQIDFYVLGRPDQYPVGSVRRFGAAQLPANPHGVDRPFYLVHSPQGFYAVAADHQGCRAVTYDAEAQQFACPEGPRWSLDGVLTSNPDPARFGYGGQLDIPMVRISLDGHVLASNEAFVPDVATDLALTAEAAEPSPTPGSPTPEPSADPYPRGAFQWCPDVAGSVAPDANASSEAREIALKFAVAYASGNEQVARSMSDAGAYDQAFWSVVGKPGAISVVSDASSAGSGLVTFGCGPDVAAQTWEVTLDDGTDSASLDFTLYVIQRTDGWKVWGSY